MHRILVPLDGSTEAETALGAAMPIVRAFSSEITLLHVLVHEDQDVSMLSYLKRAQSALARERVDVRCAMRVGRPAREILAYSPAPDLIAMTSHGRHGLRRLILGSVAEAVLAHTDVPVLVTRPRIPLRLWTRMLAPLDGSSAAERVLPDLAHIARAVGAYVDLVGDSAAYLASVADVLDSEGVAAGPILRTGASVAEILAIAEERGTGLICMSGVSETSRDIVRGAPCPVLVRRAAARRVPWACS